MSPGESNERRAGGCLARFPILSSLALLYPIGAMLSMSNTAVSKHVSGQNAVVTAQSDPAVRRASRFVSGVAGPPLESLIRTSNPMSKTYPMQLPDSSKSLKGKCGAKLIKESSPHLKPINKIPKADPHSHCCDRGGWPRSHGALGTGRSRHGPASCGTG